MNQSEKQAKVQRILAAARKAREQANPARRSVRTSLWDRDGDRVWRAGVDPAWGWKGGILIELTPERAASELPAEEAVSPAQHATITRFDRETKSIQREILRGFREEFGPGRRADEDKPLTLLRVLVRAQETGVAPLCLDLRGSRYDDGEHGLTALFEHGELVEVGTADLFPRGDWGV